ncbi:MAG: ribonuclease HII [Peptostreptococcaceae bacterium]|nr:ribonuclease HII [Peptostreptococcaceae bacterium]
MKKWSIDEIKRIMEQLDIDGFNDLYQKIMFDERKGVQKLIAERKKYFERVEVEKIRIKNLIHFDQNFGSKYVAGIDEVGRGPLAGPVVAACVVMDLEQPILGINDSKKISKTKREELYHKIIEKSLFCAIGEVDNRVIDEENILKATFIAMNSAIDHIQKQMKKTSASIDLLLIDGNQKIPYQHIPQKTIVKGDAKSYSIACASILAKVYRDKLMEKMDSIYPGYDFISNVGYGTGDHIAGIKRMGLSPIHRRTFCTNFIDI